MKIKHKPNASRIAFLARQCPQEYTEDYETSVAMNRLVANLIRAGFPHLSMAVRGGIIWVIRLKGVRNLFSIQCEDEQAQNPVWSWNTPIK